ncbi:MAG: hypothetical protein Phyf2KO_10370 [Phycisphaerales bacterium]
MTEAVQTIEAAAGTLSAAELGEVFSAFNDVTTRLQETHERLTSEVIRLKGELRRANDELDRSRRLAALGEMAAGIAHEVRNPLGSIGLYAEMLIADLNDREQERETAEKIKRAVTGLDAVVGDVLTFSRSMQVRRVELSAADAVERALASCQDVLSKCKTHTIPSSDADVFDADHALLQQALVNIVRNAAEAATSNESARSPEIEITWLPCKAEVEGDETDCVSIVVSDSGSGLTDEVRERMFNPFFTTRNIGTGLGLAIVHRIIDAHGGHVRVSNAAPGAKFPGGAVVELTIPKNLENTKNSDTPPPGESGGVGSDR